MSLASFLELTRGGESLAASMNSSYGQDAPLAKCTGEVVRCPDNSFVHKDPDNKCEYFACSTTRNPSREPTPRPTEKANIISMASSVHSKYNTQIVGCTKELFKCSDGHYVGRI
mmetsp:Transcript_6159/g.10844  ORF Transcript_6159/g.10844 Transcript_6159/m.10844 type:complete len:114 (-) Transcript_6159:162-503(-)